MKLILAIVNNDDSAKASSALTDAGFSVTRLSTTGGFLMVGNTTFLIGTDDDRVQTVLDVLKKYCTSRKRLQSSAPAFGIGVGHMSMQEEVTVGGATVFVLDVAKMEKF